MSAVFNLWFEWLKEILKRDGNAKGGIPSGIVSKGEVKQKTTTKGKDAERRNGMRSSYFRVSHPRFGGG
jgi:hypothetical protein